MLPEHFTGLDVFLYAALWWAVAAGLKQCRR